MGSYVNYIVLHLLSFLNVYNLPSSLSQSIVDLGACASIVGEEIRRTIQLGLGLLKFERKMVLQHSKSIKDSRDRHILRFAVEIPFMIIIQEVLTTVVIDAFFDFIIGNLSALRGELNFGRIKSKSNFK